MPGPNRLFVAGFFDGKIYIHEGLNAVVIGEITFPPDPEGLAHDGVNLYSCDLVLNMVYKHAGTTSTITDSLDVTDYATLGPHGLAWNSVNLLSSVSNSFLLSPRIYQHDGFSTLILNQFSPLSTTPTGLAWDGVNLLECRNQAGPDIIVQYVGFSAVILNQIFAPAENIAGLEWVNANLVSCNRAVFPAPGNIFVHVGFSNVIADTFPGGGSSYPVGLAWGPFSGVLAPTGLLCCDLASSVGANGECIPAEISQLVPYFSAIFNYALAGFTGEHYRIQVNTESDFSGTMLWDSGKISMNSVNVGDRSENFTYGGDSLALKIIYYWRIKFWDDVDDESPWSEEMACFRITLGRPYDLLCEQKQNPIDVTDPNPEFSAIHPG